MLRVIEIIRTATTTVGAIAEGQTRSILNIRTSVMVYREENYCRKCPLSHNNGVYTGTCNSDEGGCGCGVTAKTSQNLQGCPKKFWFGDWHKPDLFAKFLKENPIKK